ncbi:putative Protein disulfide-isomerase [Blattamonas nauphoetae]|uniref:Thioredoxin domain-containing protein n=1 Tax=Blattamonas nauphoetae TaxID=2049346 RepID=A0ABQ9Y4J6_9EUKA|nr:putative Protein disulfide-isomerase [Blattamonas nauphoetae]
MIIPALFTLVISVPIQVIEINRNNIEKTEALTPIVILYVHPEEESSQEMQTALEGALPLMESLGTQVGILNCSRSVTLCRNKGVKKFPELKLHTGSHGSDVYKGEVDPEAIADWVEKKTEKAVRVFPSRENVEPLIAQYPHVVLGSFKTRNADFKTFIQAQRHMHDDDIMIAVVDKNLTKNTIEFIDTQINTTEFYTKPISMFTFPDWISTCYANPLVDEISELNAGRYLDSEIPVGYFFVNKSYENVDMNHLRTIAVTVAKAVKDRMLIVIVDHNRHWRMTSTLGLDGLRFPAFTIESLWPSSYHRTKAHFPFLGTPENIARDQYPVLTAENVLDFCERFLRGEVPVMYRSEPVPEGPLNKSEVIKIVGDTFNSTILDSDDNVFIKFTAPWCNHCKKLKADFLTLTEMIDPETLIFADFDVTTNDPPPGFPVEGFPTILLFKKEDKLHPIKCETFYSLEKIKKFLNKELKLELPVDEQKIKEEDEKLEKEKEEREAKEQKKLEKYRRSQQLEL